MARHIPDETAQMVADLVQEMPLRPPSSRSPFRLLPPVETMQGTLTRGELEYEETVQTVLGPRRLPFRVREGERGYEAILVLMKQHQDLQAQVQRLERELETERRRKGK